MHALLVRATLTLAIASIRPTLLAVPDQEPREGKTTEVTLPGNRPLTLVWIPPGFFVMGSPEGEAGRRADEGPRTRVTITRGFWLGKTHVTQSEFRAVMEVNPSAFQSAGPDAPVESVSWFQAMEFCRRLSVRERAGKRLPVGFIYTLPTEAEWEYACRAGSTGPFYGGTQEKRLARIAWYKGNAAGTTHPVARKDPNAWGLYDMLGNLWEWCSDWYGPYPGGNVTDPEGPPAGLKRNNRGGSWDNFSGRCRAAARSPDDARIGNTALGFRLALAPALPLRQ